MDRGAWWATAHGIAKSWTRLSNFDFPLIPLLSFLTSQEPTVIQTFRRLLGFSAAAKSLQSCPTLCDSIDSSPPGSPIPGILQARTLEWDAISFFNV